jgi:hypothetical protein
VLFHFSIARASAEVSRGGDLKTLRNLATSVRGISYYFWADGQPRQTMVTLPQENRSNRARQP